MVIRGKKVILDSDLAALYGVETRRLNEQVRRNIEKFPEDFMFQLTKEEFVNLKSQIATSSSGWGGRRKAPLVFTEHGALQAANVLNSVQANKMSVYIVRAFIRLREIALTNDKLARKVEELEQRVSDHDEVLIDLVREIRQLIETAFGDVVEKIDYWVCDARCTMQDTGYRMQDAGYTLYVNRYSL